MGKRERQNGEQNPEREQQGAGPDEIKERRGEQPPAAGTPASAPASDRDETETVTREVVFPDGTTGTVEEEEPRQVDRDVLYDGPDGFVEDSVAPYNGEDGRYMQKGKTYRLPRELAESLVQRYEGFKFPGEEEGQASAAEGNAERESA